MNPQIFPSFADYQSALQHPEMAFSTNFLRKGSVESDLWGFPRVRSGGFALTYKVSMQEVTWAARCFHRAVRDRSTRYTRISEAIEERNLPFFVPTRYLHRGIVVQGKHFPISVLEWVEGESLEAYILHNLRNKDELLHLSEKFRAVCHQLEANDMAHGDLSHRNILVRSDDLYLIDYDGMYVPALTGRKSSELGNIHFQHPGRTNTFFNSRLDRFSSIVIYLALLGLAADPALWDRFQSGGEGLIFQKADFLDPRKSQLLFVLERNSLTSRFIPRFRQICQSPVDDVPSLEELISKYRPVVPANLQLWDMVDKRKHEAKFVPADQSQKIREMTGEITTVIGKVTEVFHGCTPEGEDHIFINFGDWKESCFTCVLWGSVLEDFHKLDSPMDNWVGQWMRIHGLVSVRNNRPQIQVDMVTDCTLLESAEMAKKLLQSNRVIGNKSNTMISETKEPVVTNKQRITANNTGTEKKHNQIHLSDIFKASADPGTEDVLNQLYSNNKFKTRKRRRKGQ